MDQRSTPPVSRAAAGTRSAPSAPRRRHPADDLDLAVHDAEVFARDYRECVDRGHRQCDVHDLEERAQAIAAAILAPFRGRVSVQPVNPPTLVYGGKAWW